jgi:hypothetical protein
VCVWGPSGDEHGIICCVGPTYALRMIVIRSIVSEESSNET